MVVIVVDAVEQLWESEYIPGQDLLYMRIHQNWIDEDGEIIPGVFKDHGGGMSTDWQKYSTPDETRARTEKPTTEYAVISFVVTQVREIPDQTVIHTPLQELLNRAHTDIVGEKDKRKNPEARVRFSRIFQWSLRMGE